MKAVLSIVFLAVCGCRAPASGATAPTHPPLFEPLEAPAERFVERAGRRLSLHRGLRVRDDLLDTRAPELWLTLNPFEDVRLAFRFEPALPPSPGSFAWVGVRADGAEATMVFRPAADGRASAFRAHLLSPAQGVVVSVDPVASVHVAQRLDAAAAGGDCLAGEDAAPKTGAPAPAAAPEWFDLLVLYTDAAAGAGDIDSLIDLALVQANAALSAAGITTRFRIVHRAKVDYAETGTFGQMLQDLTLGQNGLKIAHLLRDKYRADLVSLLVARSDAGGKANVMKIPGAYFADQAFSVVSRAWATTNYSFIHELGHNLGCCHQLAGSFLCQPDAHGWLFNAVGQDLMTIMARGVPIRILRFSDPAATVLGTPIGVAGQADNARVIGDNASIVAGFR